MVKVKIKKYQIGDKTYKLAYIKNDASYSYLGVMGSVSENEKQHVENTYFNDIIFASYLGNYQPYFQAFVDSFLKKLNENERNEYEKKASIIRKKTESYLKKFPEVKDIVVS